jgi:hypothetical protein
MHANQVEDKNVAAPRGHHVKVRPARGQSPKHRRVDRVRRAQCLHPAPKREYHGRDGDTFIVVTAAHAAHQVRRNNGHHECRQDGTFHGRRMQAQEHFGTHSGCRCSSSCRCSSGGTITVTFHEIRVQVVRRIDGGGTFVRNGGRNQRGQDAKPRGNVATHIIQAHAVPHDVIFDPHGGKLHAGINSRAHGTSEGIPNGKIKPCKKALRSIPIEILSWNIAFQSKSEQE